MKRPVYAYGVGESDAAVVGCLDVIIGCGSGLGSVSMHIVLSDEMKTSSTNDNKRVEHLYDDHLTALVGLEKLLVDAITLVERKDPM